MDNRDDPFENKSDVFVAARGASTVATSLGELLSYCFEYPSGVVPTLEHFKTLLVIFEDDCSNPEQPERFRVAQIWSRDLLRLGGTMLSAMAADQKPEGAA